MARATVVLGANIALGASASVTVFGLVLATVAPFQLGEGALVASADIVESGAIRMLGSRIFIHAEAFVWPRGGFPIGGAASVTWRGCDGRGCLNGSNMVGATSNVLNVNQQQAQQVNPWQWWTSSQIAGVGGVEIAGVMEHWPLVARALAKRGIWSARSRPASSRRWQSRRPAPCGR